ncbi:PQQ-dependent sugar dehydrogenase [Pseudonocardia bannensis]|uniref:PQQ-dependent sugar dehydrogenase n=1 Tax=Pseudonocardia bannensis TaxID=630973 RepID=A0A848DD16_9PSEU|nr:PQQ-dependent sugar dehydrogenase [Pseudonocardia bannensis]NMH90486.1 PQQ-dependent sugar dehydrogenase [Pseudonocardia bannensis]
MQRSRRHRITWTTSVVALVFALSGCSADRASVARDGEAAPAASGAETVPVRVDTPQLRVSTVASGLSHPWDLGFLPDGQVLVSQRDGRFVLLSGTSPGAAVTPVAADFSDLLARGEGGLMGLVVHPDFAQSRRFTTCQTHTENGNPVDIRLVTWQLAPDARSATRVADPLVGGLPVNPSGRHSGCRPTLAADGALLVGTGDTARGTIAQDLGSLGGKVLRVDLTTGGPAAGNPFADAADPAQRLIWTYGHRNVQGVAVRPGTGEVYIAEHGPTTDDEVNRLRAGGNYGWDPAQGGTVGGYDESVPMTDLTRYPDAVPAVWSSGRPVEAICGAAFISGPQWGALDGTLAVAALRGSKLLLMTLGADGAVASVGVPAALDDTFGRLRAVRSGPDGALFVTSSNGTDDVVLRIDPA